jgi:hypothetical protein
MVAQEADKSRSGSPTIASAALMYAQHDIPVVVFDASRGNHKECGNLVGSQNDPQSWHHYATTDPDVIRGWLAEYGPRATGIATTPGKADAVVPDVDRPWLIPADWWPYLDAAPFQSSDETDPRHGHYWFDLPPGERFGNPEFEWGEVRCDGGGLILWPTPHARAANGGRYKWIRLGQTSPLPEPIAAALRAKTNGQAHQGRGVVNDADIEAWLDAHNGNDFPGFLAGNLKLFHNRVEVGDKRHVAMMHHTLSTAFKEAAADAYPARRAHEELRALYFRTKPEATEREWRSMVRQAIEWAEADDHETRRKRMTREYGTHHGDFINADINAGIASSETDSIDFEAFWLSSPELQDLRRFARARLVGPWAMLGTTLARVIAHIPPNVVLPGIVGDVASLNLFVALTGRSGESKSASMRASAAWLKFEPDYPPLKPGSGEGLSKCFAYVRRIPANQGGGFDQIGKQWSVIAQIPEVDTLTATGGRGGSTILSELRSAWSGERIGLDYAGEEKRIVLRENRYRLCVVVGVQPLRAKPLLDDADAGTPQRFIWLPARDADMPTDRPPEPARLDLGRWPDPVSDRSPLGADAQRNTELDKPPDPSDYRVLEIPQIARETIEAHQIAVHRGNSNADPLDGHVHQCRLRVAAALMALEGRRNEVTQEDWERAGTVMAVSHRTRRAVIGEIGKQKNTENENRGRFEGIRADIADQTRADRTITRISDNIVRILDEKFDGEAGRAEVRKKIAFRDRDCFDDAEELSIADGRIEKVESENTGPDGFVLRLAKDASK